MYAGTGLADSCQNYQNTATKIVAPETVPQQVESLMKAAAELRQMCGMAADNISGAIPQPGNECKPPSPSTIQDRLREVGFTLQDAIASQQRVMRALAL